MMTLHHRVPPLGLFILLLGVVLTSTGCDRMWSRQFVIGAPTEAEVRDIRSAVGEVASDSGMRLHDDARFDPEMLDAYILEGHRMSVSLWTSNDDVVVNVREMSGPFVSSRPYRRVSRTLEERLRADFEDRLFESSTADAVAMEPRP